MRITLIFVQLCLLALIYLFVAVPVVATIGAAFVGLAYAAITAPADLLAGTLLLALHALIHAAMVYLGYAIPVTASLTGFGPVLLIIFAPLLVGILLNLACGLAAVSRRCHKTARRIAIGYNILGLLYYGAPLGYMIASGEYEAILFFFVPGYFVLCLVLVCRMPETPQTAKNGTVMPPAHIALWLLLALAGIAGIGISGTGSIFAIVCVLLILAFSFLPLRYSYRAAKKFAENSDCLPWKALAVSLLLALGLLILLPPVGTALLLSASLLYFQMESAILQKRRAATV